MLFHVPEGRSGSGFSDSRPFQNRIFIQSQIIRPQNGGAVFLWFFVHN
jgi:hypothetical protein